jgi:hypothetical protein
LNFGSEANLFRQMSSESHWQAKPFELSVV